MAFQPFQNDLGRRAFDQICGVCWAEWLKTQQQLINHYGLNLREPKAKEFLFQNMEQFLFVAQELESRPRSSCQSETPDPLPARPAPGPRSSPPATRPRRRVRRIQPKSSDSSFRSRAGSVVS